MKEEELKVCYQNSTGGVPQGLLCSCVLVHAPHPCNPSELKPCSYLKQEQSSLIKRAFSIKKSYVLIILTTVISHHRHIKNIFRSIFVMKVYQFCYKIVEMGCVRTIALLILCTKWITSKQQSSTLMSFIFKVMWFPVW